MYLLEARQMQLLETVLAPGRISKFAFMSIIPNPRK